MGVGGAGIPRADQPKGPASTDLVLVAEYRES